MTGYEYRCRTPVGCVGVGCVPRSLAERLAYELEMALAKLDRPQKDDRPSEGQLALAAYRAAYPWDGRR